MTMDDWDNLFERLSRSTFRRRFRLSGRERAYFQSNGLAVIVEHARGFVTERLAPAKPKNDGKQTPMRNHPVFIAQHATGTCCRGCLEKWHGIEKGLPLTGEQIDYVVLVIQRWLERQGQNQVGECDRKESSSERLFD